MSRRFATLQPRQPDTLILAAGTWLACGCVLLGLTPLPAHDATWGWAPLYWLLVAPAVVLGVRCLGRLQAQPVFGARCRHGQTRARHAYAAPSAVPRGRASRRRQASPHTRRAV